MNPEVKVANVVAKLNMYNPAKHKEIVQPSIAMTVPSIFTLSDLGCENGFEFYLKWINGKGFHVITPDLVEEGYVTNAYSATLYVGMKPNGTLFLLPVTKPLGGHSSTWYEGWKEIIPAAQEEFVAVKADRERFRHVHEAKPDVAMPRWPDFDYQDLINQAFEGRVVQTMAELSVLEGHDKLESYLPEEDDE